MGRESNLTLNRYAVASRPADREVLEHGLFNVRRALDARAQTSRGVSNLPTSEFARSDATKKEASNWGALNELAAKPGRAAF